MGALNSKCVWIAATGVSASRIAARQAFFIRKFIRSTALWVKPEHREGGAIADHRAALTNMFGETVPASHLPRRCNV
jgi:hypothetical protein